MAYFALRRIVQTIPVLLLTSIIVFMLLRMIPGDPAITIAGTDASPEVLAAVRADLGLDRPIVVQYLIWIGNAIRGDLGHSYHSKIDVTTLVMLKLPATVELALASFVFSLVLAVPLGLIAGLKVRTRVDMAISALTAFGTGLPNFWIGILFILLFALNLKWLPAGGRVEFAQDPGRALQSLILPAITLAIPQAAILARFIKGAVVDVMFEDYVRTARAKGLTERAIAFRHIAANSMIPVVTVLGMQFGRLLGGAVIIESVFTWPGLGRLMVDAIGARDYAVIQSGLLLLVTGFVLVNLLTDLSYGLLDPRIRGQQS
jgi:peptide/nickel transport system permease protein